METNLRMLSVNQVIERTGWPRSMVYRLIETGQVPSFREGARGRNWIRETDLEAFIAARIAGGADAPAPVTKQARRAAADAAVLPKGEERSFD